MPGSVPFKRGHEHQQVLTTTEARQGQTLGVVRYVLFLSLLLAFIAFVLIYAIYFWPG